MILNEDQIKSIVFLLKTRNEISSQHILEEMTDHFCCLVEKEMILGDSFEKAFDSVSNTLLPTETQPIEKQLKKLEFKAKLKRKFQSISAVAATLILLLVAGADAQIKPEGSPIKENATITSSFGEATDPIKHTKKFHRGIDFKIKLGTPIYATGDGVVEEATYSDTGYGNKIVINHEESYQTVFGHLSKIEVSKGILLIQEDLQVLICIMKSRKMEKP